TARDGQESEAALWKRRQARIGKRRTSQLTSCDRCAPGLALAGVRTLVEQGSRLSAADPCSFQDYWTAPLESPIRWPSGSVNIANVRLYDGISVGGTTFLPPSFSALAR